MNQIVEFVDRFAILRQALSGERYDDAEVEAIADRCCELDLVAGSVVANVDRPFQGWLIVVSGQLDVRDDTRHWSAGGGAIVQPCRRERPGTSACSVTASIASTVLLVTDDAEHSDR